MGSQRVWHDWETNTTRFYIIKYNQIDIVKLIIKIGGNIRMCMSTCSACPALCTPWIATHKSPLCMGFPRQEYWRWFPFSSLGDLANPGIETVSLLLSHQESYNLPQNMFKFRRKMMTLSWINFVNIKLTKWPMVEITWNYGCLDVVHRMRMQNVFSFFFIPTKSAGKYSSLRFRGKYQSESGWESSSW